MVQSHIVDYTQIEALTAVLADSATITELEVRQGDVRLRLRRPTPKPRPRQKPVISQTSRVNSPSGQELSPEPVGTKSVPIIAEYVGIFHANRRVLLNVGDTVRINQVLGQIETMRLMNDCIATIEGRLQAILVVDGQPVEYGQPLFEIVPEEI